MYYLNDKDFTAGQRNSHPFYNERQEEFSGRSDEQDRIDCNNKFFCQDYTDQEDDSRRPTESDSCHTAYYSKNTRSMTMNRDNKYSTTNIDPGNEPPTKGGRKDQQQFQEYMSFEDKQQKQGHPQAKVARANQEKQMQQWQQKNRRTITTSRDMIDGGFSCSNRTFEETLPLPAIPPPSNTISQERSAGAPPQYRTRPTLSGELSQNRRQQKFRQNCSNSRERLQDDDEISDDRTLQRSKKLLQKSIQMAKQRKEQFAASACSVFNSDVDTSTCDQVRNGFARRQSHQTIGNNSDLNFHSNHRSNPMLIHASTMLSHASLPHQRTQDVESKATKERHYQQQYGTISNHELRRTFSSGPHLPESKKHQQERQQEFGQKRHQERQRRHIDELEHVIKEKMGIIQQIDHMMQSNQVKRVQEQFNNEQNLQFQSIQSLPVLRNNLIQPQHQQETSQEQLILSHHQPQPGFNQAVVSSRTPIDSTSRAQSKRTGRRVKSQKSKRRTQIAGGKVVMSSEVITGQINALQKKKKRYKAKLAALRQQTVVQDQQIMRMSANLTGIESQACSVRNENERIQHQLVSLQNDYVMQSEQVVSLQAELHSAEQLINHLKLQNEQKDSVIIEVKREQTEMLVNQRNITLDLKKELERSNQEASLQIKKCKEQESALNALRQLKKGIEVDFAAFKTEMDSKDALISQLKEQLNQMKKLKTEEKRSNEIDQLKGLVNQMMVKAKADAGQPEAAESKKQRAMASESDSIGEKSAKKQQRGNADRKHNKATQKQQNSKKRCSTIAVQTAPMTKGHGRRGSSADHELSNVCSCCQQNLNMSSLVFDKRRESAASPQCCSQDELLEDFDSPQSSSVHCKRGQVAVGGARRDKHQSRGAIDAPSRAPLDSRNDLEHHHQHHKPFEQRRRHSHQQQPYSGYQHQQQQMNQRRQSSQTAYPQNQGGKRLQQVQLLGPREVVSTYTTHQNSQIEGKIGLEGRQEQPRHQKLLEKQLRVLHAQKEADVSRIGELELFCSELVRQVEHWRRLDDKGKLVHHKIQVQLQSSVQGSEGDISCNNDAHGRGETTIQNNFVDIQNPLLTQTQPLY